mmetsp:Transcript_15595/g.45602  ORF Transcript_15595/g.45602 Transcript_15595/m.45602 type:complete len:119 (-) Transcript_15595:142-498(-)
MAKRTPLLHRLDSSHAVDGSLAGSSGSRGLVCEVRERWAGTPRASKHDSDRAQTRADAPGDDSFESRLALVLLSGAGVVGQRGQARGQLIRRVRVSPKWCEHICLKRIHLATQGLQAR